MKRDSSLDGHKKVVIGGPAYAMKVSAKHADTCAFLAVTLRQNGWKVDVWHRHSSILVENRDSLLRGCIENGVDVFISIDADTYIADERANESVAICCGAADYLLRDEAIKQNLYCIAAPVRQRNGKWNIVNKGGAHYENRPEERIVIPSDEAEWCAFAFAIHRVSAYYDWYESKEPFYQFGWSKERANKKDEKITPWIGEDSYHSMYITRNGGRILVEPGIQTAHDV